MNDTASYRNVEVLLDDVVTQRKAVEGAEQGTVVYGVTLVPASFTDPALPVGANVKLFFGQNDEIILTADLASFEFACGHKGGVFFTNAVSLPGKRLRLLLDYSGGMGVNYAA